MSRSSFDQKRYCIDTPYRLACPSNSPTRVEVLPAAASTPSAIAGLSMVMRWNATDYQFVKRQSQFNSGQWVAIDDARTVMVGSVSP